MSTVKFANARIINNNTVIANVQYSYVGGEGMKRKARAQAAARYWNMVAYTEAVAWMVVCLKEAKMDVVKVAGIAGMDDVVGHNGVVVGTDAVEGGVFKVAQGKGYASAMLFVEVDKEINEITEVINKENVMKRKVKLTEGKVHGINFKGEAMKPISKDAVGNEFDTLGLGDGANNEAYCYNMHCGERDKSVALKLALNKMGALGERVNKGNALLKGLYTTIVKTYGWDVITARPEVKKGSEIVLSKYNSDHKLEATDMTVNMAQARIAYSHYKDGNVNKRTQYMFTNKYGYETGIKMFNEYAVIAGKFNEYLSLLFKIFGMMKDVSAEIKAAKEMEAITPTVSAVPVYDEEGHRIWVCPTCGEVVRPFGSYNETHFGINKDTVEKELKYEKYDFGNGRIVTLDHNGDIVNDTANEAMVELELNEVLTTVNVNDLVTNDSSVFTSACEDYVKANDKSDAVENYYADEYGYTLITNEDMAAFFAEEAASQEQINHYNEVMKSHKLESKWNEYRTGMSLVEAGWMFSYKNEDFFRAGGRYAEFYNYEEDCIGGENLDFSNAYNILAFRKLAGNAFNVSEDRLETLRHNEYVALLSSFNFEDWGVQDITNAADTVKGAEKKSEEKARNARILENEYNEVMSRDESTWTADDKETIAAYTSRN